MVDVQEFARGLGLEMKTVEGEIARCDAEEIIGSTKGVDISHPCMAGQVNGGSRMFRAGPLSSEDQSFELVRLGCLPFPSLGRCL